MILIPNIKIFFYINVNKPSVINQYRWKLSSKTYVALLCMNWDSSMLSHEGKYHSKDTIPINQTVNF